MGPGQARNLSIISATSLALAAFNGCRENSSPEKQSSIGTSASYVALETLSADPSKYLGQEISTAGFIASRVQSNYHYNEPKFTLPCFDGKEAKDKEFTSRDPISDGYWFCLGSTETSTRGTIPVMTLEHPETNNVNVAGIVKKDDQGNCYIECNAPQPERNTRLGPTTWYPYWPESFPGVKPPEDIKRMSAQEFAKISAGYKPGEHIFIEGIPKFEGLDVCNPRRCYITERFTGIPKLKDTLGKNESDDYPHQWLESVHTSISGYWYSYDLPGGEKLLVYALYPIVKDLNGTLGMWTDHFTQENVRYDVILTSGGL